MPKLVLGIVTTIILSLGTTVLCKAKGTSAPPPDIQDAVAKLKSPDPEDIVISIQTLAISGSSDAVGPLVDLLRTGPRNDITDMIIQALGAIGDPAAIEVLLEYLEHRRPDARIASLFALEGFNDPRITAAFENKLRDSDPQVRATAALALGKRGNTKTVPILFQAFERGVTDAIISIGQLGTDEDSKRATEYLGKTDVNILLPGFEQFLVRSDISDTAKLNILDQLFELAGPDVRRFTVVYKATFPPKTKESENPVYKKVNQIIRQIPEK